MEMEVTSTLTVIHGKPRERYYIRGLTLKGKSGEHRSKLRKLRTQLVNLLQKKPSRPGMIMNDQMSDCGSAASTWVSRWVDVTKKYGFGYQLCDDRVGTLFNDCTELIMFPNGKDLLYIDRAGSEFWYSWEKCPTDLEKKVKLIRLFRAYLERHLVKTAAPVIPTAAADSVSDSEKPQLHPFLQAWFRTKSATFMSLTNGVFQVNFKDHSKLILCPETSAVTFHDARGACRTFRFESLETQGCNEELVTRLKYALEKLTKMMKHQETTVG